VTPSTVRYSVENSPRSGPLRKDEYFVPHGDGLSIELRDNETRYERPLEDGTAVWVERGPNIEQNP